jgi:hypothetical protein
VSEVVNLRTVRKQRRRAEARGEAAVRAAAAGEGKPVRALRAAEAARAERALEGHRREGGRDGED